ncbi:3-hydroxyanthranilate 3,4-dioxygenase [Nocardia zapadnayensis]|uniref:3-hydroxyanthranilate 3,4-dioxygenase n=1 Tax=Nocardia rhamnosiphila TaxID=426716 RepID=UPI00224865BA|nr:3-hydroxyanthranilate 3,4-dioxygenase [Nocardia zapadnayensis]MCX0271836.1 3-hydroxyanthranilate 3,4-dioxygenase [Nocardia zapadnayensis]
MTTILPPVIDFQGWIDEHAHLLKPPVNNRTMALGKDFIVQIVGGPNKRTDFHLDPYEEWFYQIKGDMYVTVMTDEGPTDVHIREGQAWLLPRDIPHSPQRPTEGSIGLVIERVREDGTLEKFLWFCAECNAPVHEIELQVRDIVADLPPVFEEFYNDESARRCSECGALHRGRA